MKKNYILLALLAVGLTGFSQEFTIDFEGADPLNNLPLGVTSVNPTGEKRCGQQITDFTLLPQQVELYNTMVVLF